MRTLVSMIMAIVLGFGLVTVASASTNNDVDTVANLNQPIVKGKLVLHQEVLDALVEPYLEEIVNRDSDHKRMLVWIIADDGKTYKVFYDQQTRKFGLAKYAEGNTPFTSDSLHVDTELTRVFLARR